MKKIFVILCVYTGLYLFTTAIGVTIQQRSKVGGPGRSTPGTTTVVPVPGATPDTTAQPDNTSDQSDTSTPAPIPAPVKAVDTTPVVIIQQPIIAANVYLINIMPFPVQLSYRIKAQQVPSKTIVKGPDVAQPGQVVKMLQLNIPSELKPGQSNEFTITLAGTIVETGESFNASALQRIINIDNATNFEYSLMGNNPAFKDDWASTEKSQSHKITIGQTDIFFDYTARENTATTDLYYCIAPKQVSLTSDTTQAIIGKDFKTVDQLAQRVWKDMFATSASALKKLDDWIPPRPEIRYDQTTFLGTHASFANIGAGFLYAKQIWTIKQQLENGVRVLQLNFSPNGDAPARMCLGSCSEFLHSGAYHTVLEILKIIKAWLDTNKNEILTLILDNKLSAEATLSLLSQAELLSLALTKEKWEPVNRDGAWPRIGWMQLYQKRLVIFDRSEQNIPTKYGYPAKQYIVQNTPYTLDTAKAGQLYGIGVKPIPHLFQCNYYDTIAAPSPLYNTPEQLKKLLAAVRLDNYTVPGQVPNFLILDHIEMGNPMALVNELNKAAQSQ